MPASVLLIDDGELDDVRSALAELGVDFEHLRGGAVPAHVEPPSRLFVATSRRAMIARDWPPGSLPVKVGIVTEDSNTLRSMLKRIGFDLLVRRPVHPYALRLVLLKALYTGEERRREQRLPIGAEVSYRSGFRMKGAILADLSQRGCRLLVDAPPRMGARIQLSLPKSLGPRGLSLKARVMRVSDRPDALGHHTVGLAFEDLKPSLLAQLREVLRARREGPAVLGKEVARAQASPPPAAPPPAPQRPAAAAAQPRAPRPAAEAPPAAPPPPVAEPAAPAAPPTEPESPRDRRQHARASYSREVVSLEGEASLVLLGRDISVGGMRVEASSSLKVGASLRIAIYGDAREDPFIVRACVVREEADGSFALQFEGIAPAVASRLETIVARLPSVESLEGDEADGLGSVISRIVG